MKIPNALEEMVAGLISDETRKREEIEGILSQIHELTEPFFNSNELNGLQAVVAAGERGEAVLGAEVEPAPVLSQAEKLKNFTAAFERRGMPPDRARDAAEEALGMRDGTR